MDRTYYEPKNLASEVIKLLIKKVRLLTAHFEELQKFYSTILELPIKEASNDYFTIQVGLSNLTFERVLENGEYPVYHFAFDISNNKLMESIQWLKDRGIRLNELPDSSFFYYSKTWNATSLYFYDHAGNIVEFIARHGLNNTSMDPFQSTDLLRISEIGLVVPDVRETREMLRSRFSLFEYKDYNDKFSAVGDEMGLFILSEQRRTWLGSNKPAEIYKTEVEIECAEEREHFFVNLPYRISSTKVGTTG